MSSQAIDVLKSGLGEQIICIRRAAMDNPEMPGKLAIKDIELAVGHAAIRISERNSF
ncbi:hypothetical protein [Pedobacter westerhofensis]|uniref:hypothetical protein n=1 Tax=Pedobacter westerhofensis TaxID=425512 RepID=UPI00163D8D6A|nr:hypothetical protein [Pedobacter westerhofensis]